MKASEMGAEMLRHLSLRCNDTRAIVLKKPTGAVQADSGDYFCFNARSEALRRYWKAAKKDLLARELNGGSYAGDVGHVLIGGKRFSFFPKSGMLVRDDFARWAEANWQRFCRMDGRPIETKPEQQDDVAVDPALHMWKDIRKRAQALGAPAKFYADGMWHEEYVMRDDLRKLSTALETCRKRGEFYPMLKADCDLLAAKIAYRRREFAKAKGYLLELAAVAMRAALFVQQAHAVQGGGEGVDGDR